MAEQEREGADFWLVEQAWENSRRTCGEFSLVLGVLSVSCLLVAYFSNQIAS